MLTEDTTSTSTQAELRRRWEGQLNKFTNVVKGWQYRWFVLEPSTGYIIVIRNCSTYLICSLVRYVGILPAGGQEWQVSRK